MWDLEPKRIPGSDVVHPCRWELEEPHPVPLAGFPARRMGTDGVGDTAFKLWHGVPPHPGSSPTSCAHPQQHTGLL